MPLPTVGIILSIFDGAGEPVTGGSAVFTPTVPVRAADGIEELVPKPVTAQLGSGAFPVTQSLIPTDFPGAPQWAWQVSFSGVELDAFTFSAPAGPVSFTAAAGTPGTVTWTAAAALTSLPAGTGVTLAGSSLPAGVTAGTTYYVVNPSGDTLGLAAAPGGSPLAFTGAGSGTLTVASYYLAGLAPVAATTSFSLVVLTPPGIPAAGQALVATGEGTAVEWGSAGSGDVSAEQARAEAAEALLAPKASPAFTGTPTAPTAAPGSSTTQVATTAFVADAVDGAVAGSGAVPESSVGQPGGVAALDGTGAVPAAQGGTGNAQGTGLSDWVNAVTGYGAVADGKTAATAAMTSGSTALTATGAGFTSSDAGKLVTVAGAALVGPPAAPSVTAAATGGTVAAGTYQVAVTYVNAAGETTASPAATVTATGSASVITVLSPPVSQGCAWYAYVTQAGGSTFFRQQAAGSPTPAGTSLVLPAPPAATGANPPGSNTAAGATLSTTVSAYVSSTQVTLAAPAAATVSGATAMWGTDNTSSIQAALNAAASRGGGTVYLPAAAGRYMISSALSVANHVQVHGAGMGVRWQSGGTGRGDLLAGPLTGATVIQQASVAADGITVPLPLSTNTSFRDLVVSGPGSGTGRGLAVRVTEDGPGANQNTYVTVENVMATGFGSHGIFGDRLNFSALRDCTAMFNGGDGFNLSGAGCVADDLWSACNNGNGIALASAAQWTLSSFSTAINAGHGVSLHTCNAIALTGTQTENDALNGIEVSGQCQAITVVSHEANLNNGIALHIGSACYGVNVFGFMEIAGTSPTASVQADSGSFTFISGLSANTAPVLPSHWCTYINNSTGEGAIQAPALSVWGIEGGHQGTVVTRWTGSVFAAAPTTGANTQGDWVIDRSAGGVWVCTASGTPGTWAKAGADLAAAEATRAQAAEALLAPLASPAFTGSPTAPTQTSGDSSTKVATTAFVSAAVSGGGSGGGSGVTVTVPAPAGVTATDTPAVTTAITSLVTALATGPATLQFQDGTYQVDSNQMVIRSPNTTTVAAGSSGATPSASWVTGTPGTLAVASATGFPAAGKLWVAAAGVTNALISYTGTTGTTFTGCLYVSGGAGGTLATGGAVTGCLSNFTVKGAGGTFINQAPNRTGNVNNTGGDMLVIADCTDFTVEGLTIDLLRDTLSPIVPLTAGAASGQPSVTVAAGAASAYLAGQRLKMFGALGNVTEQQQADGYGTSLVISSITPGGGTSGGDLITFTTNLTNTYTVVGGGPVSDGYGPYAWTGAYLTPYQTGTATVAGRTLGGEDQQSCIHVLNGHRFRISGNTCRNTWESGIRLGSGPAAAAGYATSGCSNGIVAGNRCYHGYDQGVGVWNGSRITVTGNALMATGWAGVDLCCSDYCTVTSNVIRDQVYRLQQDISDGNGVAIDGGAGNTVVGNSITGVYNGAIWLDNTVLWPVTTPPALSGSYLEAGATTLVLSSTAALTAGGKYSVSDGARTEAVLVTAVTDSTHVTLAAPTRFGHPTTATVASRQPEDNLVADNFITGTVAGCGIRTAGVRQVFRGNVIRDAGSTAILLSITYDTVVESNQIVGTVLYGISVAQGGQVKVRGNRITSTGAAASPQPAINVDSASDCEITGNVITDVLKSGISVSSVHSVPARLNISGNRVLRCYNQGIIVLTADELTIARNTVVSCGGANNIAGIDLRGITHSLIEGNTCNSNQTWGIHLSDNSAAYCLYNRLVNNTCRDDAAGANPETGATWTQANGIVEAGNSDYNIFEGNYAEANGTAQLTVIGAHSVARRNVISGSSLPPPVTTPGVPASGTPLANATGHDVMVYVAGGTVTAVTVGATATGITSGMVQVPATQTVTLTYSAAPAWTWVAAS